MWETCLVVLLFSLFTHGTLPQPVPPSPVVQEKDTSEHLGLPSWHPRHKFRLQQLSDTSPLVLNPRQPSSPIGRVFPTTLQDEKQVLAQPSKETDRAHANNDRFTSEATPNISYTGVEDSPGTRPVQIYPPKEVASATVKRGLPKCALHLFRHISKAAGTTMRFIFDKQVMMGDWEFLPMCHYGFNSQDWKQTRTRFLNAARERNQSTDGPRVLVEIRNDWSANFFVKEVLPDVLKLREEVKLLGCTVSMSLLMREPVTQYVSFYRYYIDKMQRAPNNLSPPPWGKGTLAWGESILDWAQAVHNIQVREFLGDRCTSQLREPRWRIRQQQGLGLVRAEERSVAPNCQVDADGWSTFMNALDQFDVVGTTDRFDEFLLMLADIVGFQTLEYVPSNTASGEGKSGSEWKRPNLALNIVDGLLNATHYDQQAYMAVSKRQADQIRAAGDNFQKRLNIYRGSTLTQGNRKYVGGIPPQSVYKWTDGLKKPPPAAVLQRPMFYTGDAICRGFGSVKVVLVNKGSQYKCDRGCTFD